MATTGGDGKKGGITPCQQGEPPSGPSEKETQCVCSVVPSRGDVGSLDLHTGSDTSGLRKSGWGIRWTALEERGNPRALAHRSFPFLNLPLRGASKGGLGLLQPLRLSTSASPGSLAFCLACCSHYWLPLRNLLGPHSDPLLLCSPPSVTGAAWLCPLRRRLLPAFVPPSLSLPPFASSPFLPWAGAGGTLGVVVPWNEGWRRPRTQPDSTSRRAMRPAPTPPGFARTHRHTHTSLSPSLFSLAAAAASVWLCLSSALLSPPFFLSVPRVRPPPPPRERRRRSVAIRGG